MIVLAVIFGVLALVSGVFPLIRLQAPNGFALWPLKLIASAFAPLGAGLGALGLAFGLLGGSLAAASLGGLGLALCAAYVIQAVRVRVDFEGAFGPDWRACIAPGQAELMLPHRWVGWLGSGPEPGWERDLPFATVPESGRKLLCDVWTPPAGVRPSGLAFIYFHGGNWYFMDKDVLTRPFFRHLAGQGHVVMDVAYRMFPETDMSGMVQDVRRAVAWMKTQGFVYGVDPHKVVVGGASAGGHLALLAAYAGDDANMTPPELKGRDLSVRGVISEYGPTNLEACYFHTNQNKTTRKIRSRAVALGQPAVPVSGRGRLGFNKPTIYGAFVNLLGRHPEDDPQAYAAFSPDSYVHPGCPPTLLIKGRDDLVTPTPAVDDLQQKLRAAGVASVNVLIPHTDHGFDLAFPQVSPPAQAAWYVIDRFLAIIQES